MRKDDRSTVNRVFIVATAFMAFVLLWLMLEAVFGTRPKAATLYVVPVVPTVPGIEAAPSPAPFYRRGPTVRQAPSADVLPLYSPAPPNGCQRPAFEVISGPLAARGCYAIP